MSTSEVACTYAMMILHDDGIPITGEKIATLLKSANVKVESYWPGPFAKLAEKKNLDDLIMNAVGSAPAPAAMAAPAAADVAAPAVEEKKKKDEPEEESDDDMPIFDLFI
ncbi:60S acidic ribosomal protein P1-like [Argentina anserina]|uniref:60S acidic ribosomal protein P1-like n=1 Tax=Argentina anserina TaxID=57926 RepID=UPI0021768CB7|nr:60S acidic ribosomal protein P1-like [Potentilla anserina]